MPTQQTFEEVFQKAVPRLFGFLMTEYGFKFTCKEDWWYECENDHAFVHITLDRRQVSVDFKRITPEDRHLPESLAPLRSAGGQNIAIIARCLDPTADHPGFKSITRPQEVETELEKYAAILRKYFNPFLSGDFTQWPQVKACLEERAKMVNQAFDEWQKSDDTGNPADWLRKKLGRSF